MSVERLSRRGFLRGSLAAAAAGPAAARAQTARPREVALRWGIIGAGSRARTHIAAINGLPEMEIAAVCDVHEGRLRGGAERVGNLVAHYRDYRHLLASPEIDAVLICTPNLFHQDMLVAALAAGKHVLCEKPMATTLLGARIMRRAIDASERVVLFGLQLRYAGKFRDLYAQIKAGKIGAPRYLSLLEYRGDWNDRDVWQYKDPKGREMNWRFSQAATGGTLNEKSCHYLDILNWMTGGVPERISCHGGLNYYKGRETWDHATVHIDYPGGVTAVHALCLYGPPRLDFQIIGEEGSLQLMQDHILLQKRGARDAEQIAFTPEVGRRDGAMVGGAGVETAVVRMYEDFLDCAKRKRKPVVTPDAALIASKMAFLAERSSQQQRELPWERGFGPGE